MCIATGELWTKGGQKVSVPCRKCWQCTENKINDWVGRCIAESQTAPHSRFITLTYGRDEAGNADHERAAVLTYSDVQKYFKRLRYHGYPCRYLAVGEYGKEKGRAHWHCLVFFENEVPKHILAPPREGREDDSEFRFMERHWPHGWSFWEDLTPAGVRYACKYIYKDVGDPERQAKVVPSKKPPLGHQYFQDLALRYVKQGIAPTEPFYWFGDVRDHEGSPIKFHLTGVSLDNFCRAFILQWWKHHNTHPPMSSLIEDFTDRVTKVEPEFLVERMPIHWKGYVIDEGHAGTYFAEQEGVKRTWQRKKTGTELVKHAQIARRTGVNRFDSATRSIRSRGEVSTRASSQGLPLRPKSPGS